MGKCPHIEKPCGFEDIRCLIVNCLKRTAPNSRLPVIVAGVLIFVEALKPRMCEAALPSGFYRNDCDSDRTAGPGQPLKSLAGSDVHRGWGCLHHLQPLNGGSDVGSLHEGCADRDCGGAQRDSASADDTKRTSRFRGLRRFV